MVFKFTKILRTHDKNPTSKSLFDEASRLQENTPQNQANQLVHLNDAQTQTDEVQHLNVETQTDVMQNIVNNLVKSFDQTVESLNNNNNNISTQYDENDLNELQEIIGSIRETPTLEPLNLDDFAENSENVATAYDSTVFKNKMDRLLDIQSKFVEKLTTIAENCANITDSRLFWGTTAWIVCSIIYRVTPNTFWVEFSNIFFKVITKLPGKIKSIKDWFPRNSTQLESPNVDFIHLIERTQRSHEVMNATIIALKKIFKKYW